MWRKDKVLLATLLVLLAAPRPAEAQRRRIDVGGAAREYVVHVPGGAGAKADALVLVLHGGGGRPEAIAAHTGFTRLAERKGFVVAYPAALGGRWKDGRAGAEGTEDVSFLRALADTLGRRHGIPPSRRFAIGISNGAMMSYRLACDAPGTVAAIAVVAGSVHRSVLDRCELPAPVSVVALHGSEDRLVPLAGGGSLAPVPAALAHFGSRAGCRAPGTPDTIDRVRDRTIVVHTALAGCTGAAVELYEIRGGGHTWPGRMGGWSARFGRVSRELDATAVAWNFFDRRR
ncbi:MAG TPA: PHB depolymerase family esterase [Gemmatimonadales bacterium]